MIKNYLDEIDALKKEIDQYRPLPAQCMNMLREYFRIGLTYSSNALEGNTLTETETKVILEDGLTIGGKTMREHLEALGHSQAYDFMLQQAKKESFSEDDICKLHYLFYYRIDEQKAGNYRTLPIIVTGTDFEFPNPQDVPLLMQQFVQDIPFLQKKYHPVYFAALMHLRLVTIHPFIDGNGRTARLLMNLALLQNGYVITIIPPIMRSTYIAVVRQGNKGKEQQFLDFISTMVYESLKEYLRLIRSCV